MARIAYNEENFRHCRCPICPVQAGNECAQAKLEKYKDFEQASVTPQNGAKIYCSIGKSDCEGLHEKRPCLCPTCLVWYENNIRSTHYCTKGSADEIK